jgi:hypothetical protein
VVPSPAVTRCPARSGDSGIRVGDLSRLYVDSFDSQRIETDSSTITAGDGLYDVEYGRVLWVSRIDSSGVTVEPATEYDVDEPVGWPPGDRSRVITAGTTFDPREFVDLVEAGRFDVAS